MLKSKIMPAILFETIQSISTGLLGLPLVDDGPSGDVNPISAVLRLRSTGSRDLPRSNW